MEAPYTEKEDEDNQSSSSGTLTSSIPEVKPSKPSIYLPGWMYPFAKTWKENISELVYTLELFAMAVHLHAFNFLFIYISEWKLLIQI